jgi:thioester reductase-like protein
MKTYFITGATGSIGACLVPMLLRDEEVQVRLLIRARDERHLDERLRELLAFWEYRPGGARHRRIKAYRGDVSLPLFGIDPQDYELLSRECTHIIHSAGNVRMNLPLEEARKSSVDSARSIAAFASVCQGNGNLQKVEFVSTVGVGGRLSGVIPERWITEERSFHNTYEEAKAEAEVFIRGQIENGLPITVHRPSMVVGESSTGKIIHFQIFYHLCEFLSGRRTFGVLPRVEKACLDTIPVDYVASVIAWSSNQHETIGKVLHECSGPDRAMPVELLKNRIQSIFRSQGEKLPSPRTVPLFLFQAALPLISLFVTPAVGRAMKTLPFFFDYLAEEQSFANVDTSRMVETEGKKLPSADGYLERVLEYYIGHCSR